MVEFKDRIKELRENKNMSYTELGALLGKTESASRAWELGRSKPDADTLIRLAQYFDCTTDYLLGLSDMKSYTLDDKDYEIKHLREVIEIHEKYIQGLQESAEKGLNLAKTAIEGLSKTPKVTVDTGGGADNATEG